MAAARHFAVGRPGTVSFAVVDETGELVGASRPHRQVASASIIKSLFLVAYLNQPQVRDRALTPAERRLLGPMIRRSRDDPASIVRDKLGPDPCNGWRDAQDYGISGSCTAHGASAR